MTRGSSFEGKCAKVTVVADSVNPTGERLTTLQLEYPRFIHAEFMTHRVFSRNASSSRAIPVHKLVSEVRNHPAHPIHWGGNKPGMQADEERTSLVEIPEHLVAAYETFVASRQKPSVLLAMNTLRQIGREAAWQFSAWLSAELSHAFSAAGYHKQIANRLTEPYQRMRVICSSTEWVNFFRLRNHPSAQPEIQDLAGTMATAMACSTPAKLAWGQWHLPYVDEGDLHLTIEDRIRVSTARCARVSYLNHDAKRPTVEEDITLHDRLIVARPPHASPAEHQAKAAVGAFANFKGWASYRWHFENNEDKPSGQQLLL